MSALLEIEGLGVDIQLHEGMLHPVRDLSLHVERGETLAIVGESGSGKSLTAMAILGLMPRSAKVRSTRMEFQGKSLPAMSPRELRMLRGNRIAMIVQDPMTALNPSYTIGDQLVETLRAHRTVSVAKARERALELLVKVGVTAPEMRLAQHAHQLSGGIRQRVMIAMALICEPDLLIADEPTTALDVTVQAQILELLASLQRELGMGMIFITHDLGVVSRIADRVLVMYGGQMVEEGPVAQVFENPRHPYTEGLLLSVPSPGTGRSGQPLATIPGIVGRQFGPVDSCLFVDRCPYAFEACRRRPVDARPLDGTCSARCLLSGANVFRGRSAWTAPTVQVMQ